MYESASPSEDAVMFPGVGPWAATICAPRPGPALLVRLAMLRRVEVETERFLVSNSNISSPLVVIPANMAIMMQTNEATVSAAGNATQANLPTPIFNVFRNVNESYSEVVERKSTEGSTSEETRSVVRSASRFDSEMISRDGWRELTEEKKWRWKCEEEMRWHRGVYVREGVCLRFGCPLAGYYELGAVSLAWPASMALGPVHRALVGLWR